MENNIKQIIESNNIKIRSYEKQVEHTRQQIQVISQESALDIITFMDSKINSLREKYNKIEELKEQNRMLEYLLNK